jgi:putative DNA primase/helicase
MVKYLRDRYERSIIAALLQDMSLIRTLPEELTATTFHTSEYNHFYSILLNEYHSSVRPLSKAELCDKYPLYRLLIEELRCEIVPDEAGLKNIIHLMLAPYPESDEQLYLLFIPSLGLYKYDSGKDRYNSDVRCTDIGNESRLIRFFGHNLRFNHTKREWSLWDFTRWVKDDRKALYELGKVIPHTIYAEALASPEIDRDKLCRFAKKSSNKNQLMNFLSLAETCPGISLNSSDYDRDTYLFNLGNGTYDLRSFLLRPHRRHDHITKIANYPFESKATCPHWEGFLEKIFEGKANLINYIQRAVGYSLSGNITEQTMFFGYGTGNNGKSVFFETLKMLLGDYYQKAPSEMLMAKRYEGIPNDVARLQGVRMVVASETQAGRRLNEAKLKDLTGGDTIAARFLYGELFEFVPTHKIWMYGNHMPLIHGTNEGIWRRLKVIPFTVAIKPAERRRIEDLLEMFRSELSGIFNWAVAGYQEYLHAGLSSPDEVTMATEGYRGDMDRIGKFIEERCTTGPDERVSLKELYQAFKAWGEEDREFILPKQQFHQQLQERGFTSKPGTANRREIIGLRIQDALEG